MILNAQLATQSQSCTARYCPHDSDPGSDLCTMHKRLVQAGVPIVLHHVEQPEAFDPETTLRCYGKCERTLPDAAFTCVTNTALRFKNRRQRHRECKSCASERRRDDRAKIAAAKPRCAATTTPGWQHLAPRPCRLYPVAGSLFCHRHGGQR